jgi:hypothetical protein
VAEPGISEFTFAFSFLREMAEHVESKSKRLRAVPILPTTNEEAKLGYDARLPARGVVLYYQFKLSRYMHGWAARHFHPPGSPFYTTPYFEVELYPAHGYRQHNTLLKHATRHPHTFYVAPQLKSHEEFQAAAGARTLLQKSRQIRVRRCFPIHDEERHFLTFQEGQPGATQHSEPRDVGHAERGDAAVDALLGTRREWQPLNLDFALATLRDLLATHREALPGLDLPKRDLGTSPTRGSVLAYASELAMQTLGTPLVVLGEVLE